MTEVEASFVIRAAHHWPDAPESRDYLAHPHVHFFRFTVWAPVDDPDREIEFHDLQDRLGRVVSHLDLSRLNRNTISFGTSSCEHLAEMVLQRMPEVARVRVAEDDYVAAVVTRDEEESEPEWLYDWGFEHYLARPPMVTLCGSTRFKDEFRAVEGRMEDQGVCVLTVGFFAHADQVELTPERKQKADELHKWKISMSDYVFVVNPGGYIGESTRSEIRFAEDIGVPVRYLVDPS